MALTREEIIDAAQRLLTKDGLSGLTMRRLADTLGVQPGAAYYHVASKQDLLAAVAEHILSQAPLSTTDPTLAADDLRAALLPIRDSAEVISFANAFRPDLLTGLRDLDHLFLPRLPGQQASWAARTLVTFVLGFVAEEQNQAELIRAKVITPGQIRGNSEEAFRFGVQAILAGLPCPD